MNLFVFSASSDEEIVLDLVLLASKDNFFIRLFRHNLH